MGFNFLDPEIFGDALVEPYSIRRADATKRLPALNGRPRFRSVDSWPSYLVTLKLTLTEAVFNHWQAFWLSIDRGITPFTMELQLSTVELFRQRERVVVKAMSSWTAELNAFREWEVSLNVEIPGFLMFVGTVCDVIFGGPLGALSEDEIFGGPVDGLSDEEISPCSEILSE